MGWVQHLFPEETFWPAHNLMMKTLEGEGVTFDDICIDRSMPEDNAPTRKPRTGMLTKYLGNPDYDLVNSFVIGDRTTDVELAKNLGCRAIFLQEDTNMLKPKPAGGEAACEGLEDVCALATKDWDKVAEFLFAGERKAEVRRITKETNIYVAVNLDGNSRCDIHTGLGFFDHMLEQIGKHGGMDLTIHVKGDLEVDEHHTIEDTALALGDCLYRALGNKRGIERYGYALPMDDCLCQVCLDFGGRPWLVWRMFCMIDTQLCDISVLPRIILKINTKMSQKKDQRDYKSSISLSQIVELASLGIRQSPLGLMEILPTFDHRADRSA